MFVNRKRMRTENQSLTIGINRLGQIKSIRGGEISVGGGDSQDEAGLLTNELHDHVPDLLFNVGRLVAHRDLGQTRQVDERDVQDCSGTIQGEGKREREHTPD